MIQEDPSQRLIAVTGATGYVGGRLVPALLDAGYRVRCIARQPRKLDDRPWRHRPGVEVVQGDLSDTNELAAQLANCEAAYYLIHSMEATGRSYAERDRMFAKRFADSARQSGVSRIIYLGGLGEMGEGLSEHLASRREVERVLASTGVPVTVFRAAMIIGSGSASFEILRYLVERLPVMVTPSWVKTESQPVAISDVLYWLVQCLIVPETTGRTLEIGGADVLPYRDLMRIMAEELGLPRRLIVPLPVLTPRLSSLWISLVTPVSYRIARPLAEGLRNRVVVTSDDAQRLMPRAALGVRESIRRALKSIRSHDVQTRWSVAGVVPGDPEWAGGTVFTDERSIEIDAPASVVFRSVCRIGGGHGWYAGDLLWLIRGWMDTLVGGPGLRRGRRDPEHVEFGETLDFWRVIGIDRDRSLSLLAEMKLPGTATLNFTLEPIADTARSRLTMTARFRPRGILGILYWCAVVPLHNIVFGGMLKGIRRSSEKAQRGKGTEVTAGQNHVEPVLGYGRARLWLGISAIGTLVLACIAGLLFGVGERLQQQVSPSLPGSLLALAIFVCGYAIVHLPFDFLGGYLLPKRFSRSHPPLTNYLLGLARGVAVHATCLFLAAMAILLAGRYGGLLGTIAAGLGLMGFLLLSRVKIASWMAPLKLESLQSPDASDDQLPLFLAQSPDEGFTGSIDGVIRPRFHVLPLKWREVLNSEGFALVRKRRSLVVTGGGWRRGRAVAILFTAVGLALAALLVGSERIGTAGGTISFSLWFTLWSFLGLLLLPTLSRKGVREIDERIAAEGVPQALTRENAIVLDRLQDAECERPGFIETIFHPIPSVSNRLEGPRTHQALGFWDSARSSIFLSMAGIGLLGRAVHCNCGRPSLWVFLPTD